MHDHAARLVDDDDVLILVKHVERNGFRQNFPRLRLGHMDFHRVPGAQLVVRLHRPAVDEDGAALDQFLYMRARKLFFSVGEKDVETPAASLFINEQHVFHRHASSAECILKRMA